MTREEEYAQAASYYILSPVVPVGNEKLAYGDFINGVKLADQHPKKGLVDTKKVEQWIISCFEFLNEAGNHRFKIDKFIDNFYKAMEENNDCD